MTVLDHRPRAVERLAPRDREVLTALADGLSDAAEIDGRLRLRGATVTCHAARVLLGPGVRDQVQAVGLAHRTGLVPHSGTPCR